MSAHKKAVVLLSGGLDSTTTLAIAARDLFSVYALSFRYGQRHHHELHAAEEIARRFKVADHVIFDVDFRRFGGSALTDDVEVPKGRSIAEMECGIPNTYVPARNTVFLAIALAWAESLGAYDIFVGVNALDYSGYPDCRPEFIRAFEATANLGLKASTEAGQRISIHAPLIHFTKAQIIALGMSLGVDYGLTSTCYDPDASGRPCGRCDPCQLRLQGFREVGAIDQLVYPQL